MAVNKLRKSNIFQGENCVITLWFIDDECKEMRRKTRDVGVMPTCYRLTSMCCWFCLANLMCFESCVS